MSKKFALMLLLYALGNTKVNNKILLLLPRILWSSRENKMYTNGHFWRGTVTCQKKGTKFHQIKEGAIASALEGTKTAGCRKLDGN